MSTDLPPVAAQVSADAIRALGPRQRKRLDNAVESVPALECTVDDGTVRVRFGVDAEVSLTFGSDGTITRDDQAVCGCLLAPRCLHRAAVLAACPVAVLVDPSGADHRPESGADPEPGRAPASASAQRPRIESEASSCTTEQVDAAARLWDSAAAILITGTQAAGDVVQADLARAMHAARLAGLYRAEDAALQVMDALDSVRGGPMNDHPDTVVALRELLFTTHLIACGKGTSEHIGSVHRDLRPGDGFRVYGACREAIARPDGDGGVRTHLIGDDGAWYFIDDIKPGGATRAMGAGTAPVRLSGAVLNHDELSRAGLILADPIIRKDGRLGADGSVRAAATHRLDWSAEPLAAVFRRPLAAAVTARFSLPIDTDPDTARRVEHGLVGCEVDILGGEGGRVIARESLPDARGSLIRLEPAPDHPGPLYAANVSLLAAHPGTRIKILGRLGPSSLAVHPLAVAPVFDGDTIQLPGGWKGHADLGYDRLRPGFFPGGEPLASAMDHACRPRPPSADDGPVTAAFDPPGDGALWRIERVVRLAASGGRRAAAVQSDDVPFMRSELHRHGLARGSDLVTAFILEADRRARDPFGRLIGTNPSAYARAWLALALYAHVTKREVARAWWAEVCDAEDSSTPAF